MSPNMTKTPDELYSAFEVEVSHPHYKTVKYQVHRNNTELTFFDAAGDWMGTMNINRSALPEAGKNWTVKELPSGKTETFKVLRIIGRPMITVKW